MRTLSIAIGMLVTLPALSACSYSEDYWFDRFRGQTSTEAPIVPIRNMYDQDRYDNQGESAFFADGRMMRPTVPGTVAREMEVDSTIETGRMADDSGWVLTVPPSVIGRNGGYEQLVHRGQERYNIYCTPCHSQTGDGQGMVVRRNAGMPAPPSYHQDRIRHMPDGQLFGTITNGVRNMPGYYAQIPTDDRWAIVAYVRALQLSQAANQETHQ